MKEKTDRDGGALSQGQDWTSLPWSDPGKRATRSSQRPNRRAHSLVMLKLVSLLAMAQLLLTPCVQSAVINCATNCKTCYGSLATQCMTCQPGYFMMGFQCKQTGVDSCDAGYTLDARDNLCKRTINDIDYPCEPSTYNQNQGAATASSCNFCAPGSACETFALRASTSDCLAGFYCRTKSTLRSPIKEYATDWTTPPIQTSPIPSVTNWWKIDVTGSGAYNGDICQRGYHCAQQVSQMTSCTAGFYCPDEMMTAHDATLKCRQGFYCQGGASSMTPGNPNSFPSGGDTTGNICQKGYYCPIQSSKQFSCDPGYFLPYLMADEPTDCISCPEGKYCDQSGMSDLTTQDCDAGYYCSGTSTNAKQNACTYDEKCVAGTVYPVQCEPEEYTTSTKASACVTCAAGKRCQQGVASDCLVGTWCSSNTVSYCPPGKYGQSSAVGKSSQVDACTDCEAGQVCRQPQVYYQCAAGYICTGQTEHERPNSASEKGGICKQGEMCVTGVSTATECTKGMYCPNFAADKAEERCFAGHYCTGGATKPDEVQCPPGHYCELGSFDKAKCPAGTYQEGYGATQRSDCLACPEGVLCLQEALTHAPIFINPANPTQDDVCSALNDNGVGDMQCPTGITTCRLGYYCPRGSDQTSDEVLCDQGYKCPGSRAQILCEAGFFQDEKGQSVCKLCGSSDTTKGYYCDGTTPDRDGVLCPAGRYCPQGTKHADQYPCPIGTYNPNTGKKADTECLPCALGYYCQFKGQTASTTPILAGYHGGGRTGQTTPNPHKCPQTAYCGQGTGTPTGCPNGQWTPSLLSTSINDCMPCPRGKWCKFKDMWDQDTTFQAWFVNSYPEFTLTQLLDSSNGVPTVLDNWYGDCADGYICLEGATSSQPTTASEGYECPVGHYCQPGAIIEIPCPPGFYQPSVKMPNCLPCPAGFYCPDFGMTAGTPCEAGSYCSGSVGAFPGSSTFLQIRPTPCPEGTFGSPAQSSSDSQCQPCTAGKYCDMPGQLTEAGDCAAGFVCKTGADRPGPYATIYDGNQSGKCTVGSFCDSGALQPTACAQKKYSISLQQSECYECPPGFYCKGGSHKVECDAGYYCEAGSNTPTPTDGIMGNVCPVNNYCSQGQAVPWGCRDGTYQPSTGQSTCRECPDGDICTNGGQRTSCPSFRYCDGNTTYPLGKLCQNGYYGDEGITGYTSIDDCKPCVQGKFCTAGQIVGDCAPGFVCIEQADSHTPNTTEISDKAYPCPLGFYCSEGSIEPTRCPPATFTFETAAKQVSECTICQMGWYCPVDETEPQICPKGAYCGFEEYEPNYCPVGTFQPYEKMGNLNDCQPCSAGFHCFDRGIGNLQAFSEVYKCPEGHFCAEGINYQPVPCIAGSYLDSLTQPTQAITFEQVFIGSTTIADKIEDCDFCPRGYTCPTGTGYRYTNPCPAGKICPAGSGFPVKCPPGFFCEGTCEGCRESVECPEGFYCPAGQEVPLPCGADQVCPRRSSSPFTRGMTPQDCEPGTYLNVNRCVPCEEGHVCDAQTSQKYPIDSPTEGGYECPPGHYCPTGTTTETMKKCPVGTFRMWTRGKTIDDCDPCPDGSAQNREGQGVCILCGRGSVASDDKSTCVCNGAYRTWQPSTNTCVCAAGYVDPVITVDTQTSTFDLDCIPIAEPVCPEGQFVNDDNKCVLTTICETSAYCNGEGGFYDATLDNCFCDNVSNNPEFYCDALCQFQALRVYYTKDDKIEMTAGGVSRVFDLERFGENFLLSGLSCPVTRCQIMSQKLVDGKMVASEEASIDFVNFWMKNVDPNYQSPYPDTNRRRLQAFYFAAYDELYKENPVTREYETSFMSMYEKGQTMTKWSLDELSKNYALSTAQFTNFQSDPFNQSPGATFDVNGNPIEESAAEPVEEVETEPELAPSDPNALPGSANYIERTIQCIEPNDSVSFEVNPINFPVYIKSSKFNTDENYDYGAFSQLETKLNNAKLAISSFMVSFLYEGVFVFGDHTSPTTAQTIVLVTENKQELCLGQTQWPMTSDNMKRLGLIKKEILLREFDFWLHYIPSFFIFLAFVTCFVQYMIESRIEAAELERRMRREKASETLKKYFKKKQDKFDKVQYLGDMYKLIQQTVAEIKRQIAENNRRTNEDSKDNMNKMLKDKYSVMIDLKKSGGDKDIVQIKEKVGSMLTNLRFNDGRNLQEVLENMKMKKRLEEEQDKLRQLEAAEKAAKEMNHSDSFVSEALSDSDQDSFQSNTNSSPSQSKNDEEKDDEADAQLMQANPALADDMLAHKAALRKKREDFIATMDENLTSKQREDMIKAFDDQMTVLAASIQKEQQDQDQKLMAKLNARKRNAKREAQEAAKEVQEKQLIVTEIQDRIDKLVVQKDNMEDKGVNTRAMKAQREEEYQKRMDALAKEQDEKIRIMREDYLQKIKGAKTEAEKNKLLEDMGRRMKTVEQNLAEEKKRQEAQLQKMLKARQKKGLKQEVKNVNKEIDELEDQIDKIKQNMDAEKAQIYAEKGSASNILDQDTVIKKQKISNTIENAFTGFNNELTQVEKDDIEIHKTQLQLEKEKELNSAEAEINEEAEKSDAQRNLEAKKAELQQRIDFNTDPEEKDRLLSELNDLEKNLSEQMAQDKKRQNANFEEKRKRRLELLQLKKMQIEADQVDELNTKEVETLGNKFTKQMDDMDRLVEKELDREVRSIITRVGPGKEQALIVVNEAHDDALQRKLKILMSKQFHDLTKYLGSMHSKLAMEHMIRCRKIDMKFERDKTEAINAGLTEDELADKIQMLQAERDLEYQLSEQKKERDREEREQNVRESCEERFCQEKKDLSKKQAQLKQRKIQQTMAKMPDNDVVQEVGEKLLQRIGNTIEDEMAYADQVKEQNLERARMKIIAENDQQIDEMQTKLNEAMQKEEKKMEEQMNARRDQILALKKQNLEERLKMAGDMTQEQIKELRAQYQREYDNLDRAITEEKQKQLTNMRSAMLSRRIAKERQRRIKAEEEEAARSRAAVQKMNSQLAQAFRKMISKKMGGMNKFNKANVFVDGEDRLRARLAAWQRAVEEARGYRGGEDGEIWNMEAAREAEKAAKLEAKAKKEAEKLERENQIQFTVSELYKRIMRVERLSEVLESSGIDVKKHLEEKGLGGILTAARKHSLK